jgi:transcriptional regulator with XRE-family HTH domain
MGSTSLGQWLAEQPRGTKAQIARTAGLAYSTVHWIAAGTVRPKAATAERIAEATGGALSAAQILGLEPLDATEAAE